MYLYINLQQRIQCRKNTLYSRGQRPTPPPPPGPASSTSTHETEGRRAQTPTQDLSFPIRTGCQRGPQPECRTHAAQPSAPCPQTGRPSGTHLRRAGTVGSLCPAARGATTLTRPQRPQRFPGSPSEGSPTSSSACLPARLPARRPQALSTTWHHPEPQNRGVGLSKGEGCDPSPSPPVGLCPTALPPEVSGLAVWVHTLGGPRSTKGSPWTGSSHTTLGFGPCPIPTTADTWLLGEGRSRRVTPPCRPGPRPRAPGTPAIREPSAERSGASQGPGLPHSKDPPTPRARPRQPQAPGDKDRTMSHGRTLSLAKSSPLPPTRRPAHPRTRRPRPAQPALGRGAACCVSTRAAGTRTGALTTERPHRPSLPRGTTAAGTGGSGAAVTARALGTETARTAQNVY